MPKILAIDDKQDNLVTVSALLRNFIPDCTVITSDSGAESIKKAEAERPDTILLDIKMPEMDEYEICRQLKSNEKTKHIPVVMLTAIKTDHQSRTKGLDLGADAFLSKPIDEAELAAQVKVMLRIKTAEDLLRREKDLLEDTVREKTKALWDSQNMLKIVLDSVPSGVFWKDRNLFYIGANKTWLNSVGLNSSEEVAGKSDYELSWTKEQADSFQEADKKVMKSGIPEYNIIEPYLKADGTHAWAKTNKMPLRDKDRNIIGVLGSYEDVTEQKRAERELLLKNIVFDTSIVANSIADLKDIINQANDSFVRMWGYKSKNEIMGKPVLHFIQDRKEAEAIISSLNKIGKWVGEFIARKKDGSTFIANANSTILSDETGKKVGYQSSVQDITERVQAEEEKRKLEARFQKAQKMEAIGILAGGIAHDFNNLLTAVQGNASLMLYDIDSTHPHYKMLEEIIKQSGNGAKLTAQLLGYARKGRYKVKPINLNRVVKKTSFTFGRNHKEITIHQELAEDLFGIKADQSQIEQVLLNLFVNAAAAMPRSGTLTLKSTNVTHEDMKDRLYDARPGRYALLTVTDTGTGMDKETLERIFEPFFTTKEMGRGTGLGLASVYGIIKGHGGYIHVDSEKGRGTTFSIYLPASDKKVETVAKPAEHLTKGSGTILLIDDEAAVLAVNVKIIEALGYAVLEAKNGRKAIEIYKANKDKIDLVILDMIMPDMGGGEAYDRMKEINPDVKVLLSSGYSIEGQATEILERGCDAFIQKPFNMAELSGAIRGLLDKK